MSENLKGRDNSTDVLAEKRLYDAYHMMEDGLNAEALSEFLHLSNQGSALASLYLGYMHLSGKGVEKNIGEAKKYFLMAANGDVDAAKYNLGVVLQNERDPLEALKWFRSAAEKGHAASMYEVYKLTNKDVPDLGNDEIAIKYLEQSAQNRYPMAMRELQRLELNGRFGFARFVRAVICFPIRVGKIFLVFLGRERDANLKKLG